MLSDHSNAPEQLVIDNIYRLIEHPGAGQVNSPRVSLAVAAYLHRACRMGNAPDYARIYATYRYCGSISATMLFVRKV